MTHEGFETLNDAMRQRLLHEAQVARRDIINDVHNALVEAIKSDLDLMEKHEAAGYVHTDAGLAIDFTPDKKVLSMTVAERHRDPQLSHYRKLVIAGAYPADTNFFDPEFDIEEFQKHPPQEVFLQAIYTFFEEDKDAPSEQKAVDETLSIHKVSELGTQLLFSSGEDQPEPYDPTFDMVGDANTPTLDLGEHHGLNESAFLRLVQAQMVGFEALRFEIIVERGDSDTPADTDIVHE